VNGGGELGASGKVVWDAAARGCGGRGPLDWFELSGPSASSDSDVPRPSASHFHFFSFSLTGRCELTNVEPWHLLGRSVISCPRPTGKLALPAPDDPHNQIESEPAIEATETVIDAEVGENPA
jgi:hypothetical protein